MKTRVVERKKESGKVYYVAQKKLHGITEHGHFIPGCWLDMTKGKTPEEAMAKLENKNHERVVSRDQ